ncbi:hypothetical protein BU26DRAFT_502326 [Trematosphaeria pertusa]|uniref:Uncharacterized protein n=1 Tax=Trematosphaeria pertusa TaxID=390896 RepID=A0A6A6INN1_9PLEO|nr:uncharacterized protein BU26DRAFT_502326 [Trematosphaeria pertusa]KAF2251708.1 hypothetical protein BU26DRAFT_502326 [Trematosphaeria pertusa]
MIGPTATVNERKPGNEMPLEKIVIFVDIPDPDNLSMIMYLLSYYRKHAHFEKIAIVLTPRILDLRVPRYGKHFKKLLGVVNDVKELIMPITKKEQLDHFKDVPQELRKWFYVDEDYDEASVREDTAYCYRSVSIMRIVRALTEQGYTPNEYDLYWDEKSLKVGKVGDPAMRHAFHVHDFKYGFNEEEMRRYENITGAAEEPSIKLHDNLQELCKNYTCRVHDELKERLGVRTAWELIKSFDDLIEDGKKGLNPNSRFFIGGPFTEAARYIRSNENIDGGCPVEVTAMAGTMTADRNIFKNQFNIHADVESAERVLRFLQDRQIPTKIVPTEAIKGVLEISTDEYCEAFKKSRYLCRLIRQYDEDKGATGKWYNFDGITAMTVDHDDLFEWIPVNVRSENEMDEETVRLGNTDPRVVFEHSNPGEGSSLKMAQLKEVTEEKKGRILKYMASCIVEDDGEK